VFIGGRQQPWNFSLAHCDHSVFAAVSSDEEVPVGVDLVPREIGQRGFADFWLTSRERRAWRPYDECQSIAKIWAVKEATYKAIGQGEPFEPTRFEVLLTADGLTCCWNGPTPSSTPRIEVFDAGPHVAVMVAINKVLSENRA
jgi:phosphopantetheinyl transferase